MKIAVIGTRGFPNVQGGVEKHCQALYLRMSTDEILVYRRSPFVKNSHETYPNIRFCDLPSTRLKGFETLFHSFFATVHCLFRKVDVVQVHSMGPGLFIPLLKLFGKRVVMTYHVENYAYPKWGMCARALLRLGNYLSLRFSDRVIFVCEEMMKRQKPSVRMKSCYIANGVEPLPEPSQTRIDEVMRRFGLIRNEYVLAVGRLDSVKGYEYLIQTIQNMPEITQLVIAGASDNQPSYRKKLEEMDINGKVVFTGVLYGDELEAVYCGARMFVLPSYVEGLPLVLLEAMSHRLPLICSRIYSTELPEIPDDHKFTAGDTEDLRACMIRHLPAPGTRVDYDMRTYDWDFIARQTHDVLAQAARKQRK